MKTLSESMKHIKEAYKKTRSDTSRVLRGSAEWLCDNYYIMCRMAEEAHSAYRVADKKHIKWQDGDTAVFKLAKRLVTESETRVDSESVTTFLGREDIAEKLSSEELKIFLPEVCCALLFVISDVCRRITLGCERDDDTTNMANAVKSLIALRDVDWGEEFYKLSPAEQVLSDEKIGCYKKSQVRTRELYRRAISRIAFSAGCSELEVAKKARVLADGGNGREAHVGYYLIDKGVNKLRKALGLPPKKAAKLPLIYMTIIFVLTSITQLILHIKTQNFWGVFWAGAPIFDIWCNIVNNAVTRIVHPKTLPALDLAEGVPDEGRSIVVYPVLLASPEDAVKMAEKLEVCYFANRDDNLAFALLGDFCDNDEKDKQGDQKIISAASDAISRLNKMYGDRFFFFHREREYNKVQKKWMGRERKRGALLALGRFLRGAEGFKYTVGDTTMLENIKYVITLDADTILPIGAAKKLIGAAIHPLNKPLLDRESHIVREGYGIISPRVSIDIESAGKTMFSRVFAGQGGTDNYSTCVSDIYMDIGGEAIYTGKGIYDIDVFADCAENVPDNSVLSHDLLESTFARCAFLSDTEIFDSYPSSFLSNAKRYHRWVRGDWQLLPWLMPRVRTKKGAWVKNPINYVSKWKIGDNMRRSLVPPLQLVLIVGAVSFLKHGDFWLALALISICTPMFLYLLSSLFSKKFFHIGEKRSANIIYGFKSWLYQVTLTIMFLPHTGLMSLDAAVRSVVRVLVTRKNTLEWVTAAESDRRDSRDKKGHYKKMILSPALGVLTFFLSATLSPTYLGFSFILAIIWGVAPFAAYLISRAEKTEQTLPQKDEVLLRDTARRTWRFFDEYMNEGENFLPPDNIQLSPYKGAAHRTSPTNIGLGMMAAVAAADMGFIPPEVMAQKLSKTLCTVEKMEKWRGHLYNWYDTKTLKPLLPRYISTVDSGNLKCYLMVCRQGVLDYKKEIGDSAEEIAERIDKICSEMHFKPLYNKKKKLFYIGYNLDEDRFSSSYYDLFASEIRQSVFLAVASGEVEKEAWQRLGRGLTGVDGYKGLMSWTGTMFEYLMPLIIMGTHKNTLLDETYFFAVRCNKKYARKYKIPWGISESGYSALDISRNYKYKAFGVPWLSLKQTRDEERVISPYSSMLALMVDTRAAARNMQRLKRLGVVGELGFFEAIDFTKSEKGKIVKSYMAHHQGMSLAAICNVLCGNIMQKRFMAYPAVRAAQPLLWEKVPVHVTIKKREKYVRSETQQEIKWSSNQKLVREYDGRACALPAVNALSNGAYTVISDTSGGGYSSLNGIRFGRFSGSDMGEDSGQRIYVRDCDSGAILDVYNGKCVFSPHMCEYKAEGDGISTTLLLCLAPEDSAEVRRLTIVNNSDKPKKLEIITYAALAIADSAAFDAHKAFSNLFIKTSVKDGALFAKRRERSGDGGTTVYSKILCSGTAQTETDRAEFIGRGRCIKNAVKLMESEPLSGKCGSVIDPCFAFKVGSAVESHESVTVTLINGMSESMDAAESALARVAGSEEDVFMSAYAKAASEQYIELDEGDEKIFTDALPYLLYGGYAQPEISECIEKNNMPREELWKLGISGDLPIVLTRVSGTDNIKSVERMIRAHEYWRLHGILCDLIILCDDNGYVSPCFEAAKEKLSSMAADMENINGGIRIFSSKELTDEDICLITACSALYSAASNEFLSNMPPCEEKLQPHIHEHSESDDEEIKFNLQFDNGYGGFDVEKSEYVIKQTKRGETPMPWINVVANKNFGFISGESGGGYTWHGNSHEMRLTAWHNDSVSDPLSEKLFIESGHREWSPMAGVYDDSGLFYTVYGRGYTKYQRITRGIEHNAEVFASQNDSVKIIILRLKNREDVSKKLRVSYSAMPLLGVSPSQTHGKLIAKAEGDTVTVKSCFSNNEYMFLSGDGCRAEIRDSGTMQVQGVLCIGKPVTISVHKDITLNGQGEATAVFLMGAGKSIDECRMLCKKYKSAEAAESELINVCAYWRSLLGSVQVKTPCENLNIMLDSYLLYQTVACRLFARSAHYQSGGALGFRDQLQDSLALLYAAPDEARSQILLHASHQFTEGDVLHWWHKNESGGPRGVRTRFSDDRLWLPYVLAEYIKVTGDSKILDECVPFLKAAPLERDEAERYSMYPEQDGEGSIYEHAVRAIDVSLVKGSHSLPLIGGGDWNDGMNLIGAKGQGESVWLAWFLISVLSAFVPICKIRGDDERAARYGAEIKSLTTAAEVSAWDGEWYRRAFFDDGTPLGSKENAECSIDSISQSWAVISGAADEKRARAAVESAEKILWDKKNKIVKLLSPPFENMHPSPGYIKGYLPGMRENGGQYTHAAVWLAIALSRMGKMNEALELFEELSPIEHSKTALSANVYKVEPYAVAADVYSVPPHTGRGGWTWYTGAAAWMYTLGLRYILGFCKEGNSVSFKGAFPDKLTEYKIEYKYKSATYIFNVKKGEKPVKTELCDDGKTHEILTGREDSVSF